MKFVTFEINEERFAGILSDDRKTVNKLMVYENVFSDVGELIDTATYYSTN